MKQLAIMVWPRPHTKEEEIKQIIVADGYFISEVHTGKPVISWNPSNRSIILFIVETNNPLRISDILGELKKNCCFDTKGFEQPKEIENVIKIFLKSPKKKR